ncbi:hypothetical protein C6P46_000769 [Rhodotorula mucilaginosa]|uniref:Uncharacterized protein n=1 Tax=Rhodotorula mucilaginosa TaxID=5537 RepID=A0A9P7B2Z5_RHOMI|nr:hypothetical protein C6P46_000769 [Rhodotorula mucilaginosa]
MMNGRKATSTSSTAEARQLYHRATRAFLVRDYATAASCLHDGVSRLEHVEQDAWFRALEGTGSLPAHVIDLRRRLDILKVTLLATVRSSPAALSPAPSLTPLLDLGPDNLIRALWSDLVGNSAPPEATEVVPTPAASHLHPSLAVSLALAALKLDAPKSARAVAEAWFGSVGEDVEVVVADFASNGTVDWQAGIDFPLDQVAGGTHGSRANQDLSDSSTTLGQAARSDQEAAVRALVGSWLKLLDLLVFHILPKLDEWDAAGDFVRLQGQENGGWVPDVRVEASLQRLKELQREQIELAAARVQRQKELELARAEKKKQISTSASSRRSTDKGKERARDERNGSPPDGSSPSRKHARGNKSSSSSPPSPSEDASSRSPSRAHASPPPPTGFASMRDSLSTYLQKSERDSPASSSSAVPTARSSRTTTTTTRSGSSPMSALVSYVRYHYATDPVRLVSFVCFVLALLTWTRRRLSLRRSRGQRGLGLGDALRVAGAKLAETVGMATKVTAM